MKRSTFLTSLFALPATVKALMISEPNKKETGWKIDPNGQRHFYEDGERKTMIHDRKVFMSGDNERCKWTIYDNGDFDYDGKDPIKIRGN